MRIGPLEIAPPTALAPLSGPGDVAFRLLCRQAGAGLVYTGMISANALHYGSHRTKDLLRFHPAEHPVCAQVLGADPDRVAAAAAAAVARGADMVDINMGCSVPKVLRGGAGAALMADPPRAEAVVAAVARAVGRPVSVKLRRGWPDRGEDAVALARRCVGAGAAVVVVHPRWATQRFRGQADWVVIARVKEVAGVPVIGNGDVRSPQDALRMVAQTGCDGVMVGRAALGNPWLFGALAAALRGEPPPPPPSIADRLASAAAHLGMLVADCGEQRAVREMRKHLAWYLKGVPGARSLRDRVNRAASEADLRALLSRAHQEAVAGGVE